MRSTNSETYSRRDFLVQSGLGATALAAGSGCSQPDAAPAERPPNIVFLLTDDQRWDMVGCMGNPIIQTPNMDRLAEEGVLFTRHHVTTSLCAPSRASTFTGLYARCHGIHEFRTSLSDDQFAASYPELLRQAGYRTGFIGKYGVGRTLPTERFEYFEGFSGQGRYLDKDDPTSRPHLTKIMGGQALEFLDGCTTDQPFCLSVSFKAPHVQDREAPYFINDPEYDDLYSDVTIPRFKKLAPEYYDNLPDFLKGDYEGHVRSVRRFPTPEKFQESMKRYYRLITGVDVQVGRIMQALKDRGFDDNTVIVFASDNGYFLGERGWAGKYLMHEESIRAPLIIRDPREAATRGTRRDETTLNIDIAPTIMSLAGVEVPPSVNGRDLRPLVAGESPPWRDEWFYEFLLDSLRIPPSEGLRSGDWKYIVYPQTDPVYEELYNLASDPDEERNLAMSPDHQEQLATMRARKQQWVGNLESWQPNQPWVEPGWDGSD